MIDCCIFRDPYFFHRDLRLRVGLGHWYIKLFPDFYHKFCNLKLLVESLGKFCIANTNQAFKPVFLSSFLFQLALLLAILINRKLAHSRKTIALGNNFCNVLHSSSYLLCSLDISTLSLFIAFEC